MDATTDINFSSDQQADLIITSDTKYFLHTAARWANFIAIIGFIGAGFIVLCALIILVSGSVVSQTSSQYGGSSAGLMGAFAALGSGVVAIFYLLLAVFYFFFAFYLFRFASSGKKAVLFNNNTEMSKSIESLKSFFKLWGIVTIIGIALGIVAVVAAIIFAAALGMSH